MKRIHLFGRIYQSLFPSRPAWVAAALLTALSAVTARADSLDAGFHHPPASAKPQTWWHWMNGNITKAGITADLEAMQRVGLGGAEIFNVDCGIPAGPVKFNSPEWFDMMKFAAQEAHRLGLKLQFHNCAGWSSSGGPWNTPADAMQRVTSSVTNVQGPGKFTGTLPQPPEKLGFYRDIAVLAFPTLNSHRAVIQNLDAKNGSNGRSVLSSPATTQAAPGSVIPPGALVDLTRHLQAGGQLDWNVPAGRWTILRIGYTPTGEDNHPAPPEGTGLECDKFSRKALDAHWNGFVQKVLDDLGPLAGRNQTLEGVVIDSYEVGGQNWTPQFRKAFERLRGYDPLPYLPALTGRVVDNPEVSERFLWDVRRTIADLFAKNYYGRFQELCHAHGLKASIEPYTGPFESLQCGAAADIPMGEFWVGHAHNPSVKLAASVGHIYGRRIIGAESFTAAPGPKHGRWLDDAYALKALGDLIFCQGVNRYILHRYALQPWTNRWPGMTMGQWGTHFDRTSTWWEQSRAWLQYVTRCQFLLQQGRFVADAAFFCGESAPVEMRAGHPPLPAGYDYDGIDAGVLLHDATVRDGQLVLKSGMRYHVLVLPPADRALTPGLLRKLRRFVLDGLTLVGAPPQASPSLEGYPGCDVEVHKLAAELWGNCDGKSVTEHSFGRGKVIWGQSLEQVLGALGVTPDFEYHSGSDAKLAYIHRRDGGTQIYFVSNQRHRFEAVECSFRIRGEMPELWDAQTGQIQPAPVWREEGGRTIVPLQFDPAGSVFVVFRRKTSADHVVAVERQGPPVNPRPKPVALHILQAAYGARPSSVEVTAEVKALVAAGTNRIAADNDLAGTDPAPDHVKQLRVEFRLNGNLQTVETNEGKAVSVPAGAEVVKAAYGLFAHARAGKAVETNVDLTAKLSGLVKDGRLSVRVDNELAGNDPAPDRAKELRVSYSLDGATNQTTVPENETLRLPENEALGAPPPFAVMVNTRGQPRVLARAPGRFTLTWASGRKTGAECHAVPAPEEIAGPWTVHFPPGWGAPAKVTFDRLESWTASTNPGVTYFSGTAAYEKQIEIPDALLRPGLELWLDLGAVKNFATVSLNGRSLGVLWKPPFGVNVTGAAHPGRNILQIKVTNLWPNRLIGDEQLPPDCEWVGKRLKAWPQWLLEGRPSPTGRVTFTTWHHWTRHDALLQSGLLGPVRLEALEVIATQ